MRSPFFPGLKMNHLEKVMKRSKKEKKNSKDKKKKVLRCLKWKINDTQIELERSNAILFKSEKQDIN